MNTTLHREGLGEATSNRLPARKPRARGVPSRPSPHSLRRRTRTSPTFTKIAPSAPPPLRGLRPRRRSPRPSLIVPRPIPRARTRTPPPLGEPAISEAASGAPVHRYGRNPRPVRAREERPGPERRVRAAQTAVDAHDHLGGARRSAAGPRIGTGGFGRRRAVGDRPCRWAVPLRPAKPGPFGAPAEPLCVRAYESAVGARRAGLCAGCAERRGARRGVRCAIVGRRIQRPVASGAGGGDAGGRAERGDADRRRLARRRAVVALGGLGRIMRGSPRPGGWRYSRGGFAEAGDVAFDAPPTLPPHATTIASSAAVNDETLAGAGGLHGE